MSGPRQAPDAGEAGSVFVEALVATAVVALVLGALFQLTADSTARHRQAEARRYALMVARSQLAAVGSAIPLATSVTEGVDGTDVWRVEIEPCGAGLGASTAGALYCVGVSVRGADGRPLVALDTRRLAPAI